MGASGTRDVYAGVWWIARLVLGWGAWTFGLYAFEPIGCGTCAWAQEPAAGRFQVSEKALAIHQRSYVFDGHNDLPWEIRTSVPGRFEEVDLRLPQPKFHTDIDRLRAGGVGAQFWSVFVPADTARNGLSFAMTVEQIDLVKEMIRRYPDVFELALSADDVDRIRAQGKIASLIGMEGGHSIEGSIGKLRQLYAMGARYMTLTHADTLEWADAATDASKRWCAR